jgi:glycosyltransferase Alg8
MLYLPDTQVVTLEYPLAKGLLPATTKLMLRWFGNMLRANSRAIALGPRRIGLFAWWCLIHQRLSMWTPLLGPVVAVLFALSKIGALPLRLSALGRHDPAGSGAAAKSMARW